MNDKYCPKGKINCNNLEQTISLPFCLARLSNVVIEEEWELCPWPSRQNPVEPKADTRVGKIISRKEALEISRETLLGAEREREELDSFRKGINEGVGRCEEAINNLYANKTKPIIGLDVWKVTAACKEVKE